MTKPDDKSPPVARKLRDAILASKWGSVRAFAPAFANAKGIDEKSALRSLRKYTRATKPTVPSESTALVLANLLGTTQGHFVSPSAAQRSDRDARTIEGLETRVASLEGEVAGLRGQIGEALALLRGDGRGRRGGQGGDV